MNGSPSGASDSSRAAWARTFSICVAAGAIMVGLRLTWGGPAKKKTRSAGRAKRVVEDSGGSFGKTGLQLGLQFLADDELDGLGGLDLDLLAGLGIHADAGLALRDLEG